MKTNFQKYLCRALTILTLAGICAAPAHASMYQIQSNYLAGTAPPYNAGGGIPAQPLITSSTFTPTNATLCWYGVQGWYSVQASTDLVNWTQVGSTVPATDFPWNLTVTNPIGPSASFRLVITNSFSGQGNCSGCHGAVYTPWTSTAHARAFADLGSSQNSSHCILCHTVGYGQPTGFTDPINTPNLENVGCENCHGPAGWHKNSDHSLILPAVSLDPAICGSCHQGHNPQYNEYTNSLHYPTVAPPVSSISQAAGCGVCHSAAMRMAMLDDYANRLNGITNALVMPTLGDVQAWGPSCATCHNPHGLTPSPVFGYVTNSGVSTNWTVVGFNNVQFRNPLWSSNFYTMPAQADPRYDASGNTNYMNTTFASMYDPTVNVCGQCHNTRGARWDGLAYGLLTNTVVSGPVTNTVYVNIYTTNTVTQVFTNSLGQPYLTNTYTSVYLSGRYATNLVAMLTNQVVAAGLTTNVTGFSHAPHLSPQYNMLIGILQPDYLNTTNGKTVWTNGVLNNGIGIYATHSGVVARSPYNTNQCATCHVPSYTGPNGIVTGHTFQIDPNGCALGGCHNSTSHGTPGAPDYVDYALENSNLVVSVADLLNTWATNTGPALFTNYNNYLQNSWEYTSPGSLASSNKKGPSASDQMLLPSVIQQARFDIYMVDSDGTFGAHNPTFIPLLIKDAETKVLSQLPIQFTAKSAYGGPGAAITFTNLTPAVSSPVWNFGDGATSNTTATAVTHAYTSVGQYTVSLTDGANSLTRNNYINIYSAPTPSFTCSSVLVTRTGTPPSAMVTFTNTSVNANFGNWAIYSGAVVNNNSIAGGMSSPLNMPQFFNFTIAGTYTVVFTASSPGGNAAVTNVNYITVH